MSGDLQLGVGLFLLGTNILGLWFSIHLLNKERRNIPFLV